MIKSHLIWQCFKPRWQQQQHWLYLPCPHGHHCNICYCSA